MKKKKWQRLNMEQKQVFRMGMKNFLKEKLSYDSMLVTPVNQALRNYPIVEFVKEIRKKRKGLKILEVGSGASGITKFLKVPVTGIDIEFHGKSSPYLKQVKHSAIEKFPFRDNEFDIVISTDCYEHLPKGKRKITLEEMYRVSKKYIAFTSIFGFHKWHQKILDNWKEGTISRGIHDISVKGSPDIDEINNFLRNKKINLRMQYGTHPRLAYYLNLSDKNILTRPFSRIVLKLFLPVFRLYNGKERIYFFITKK